MISTRKPLMPGKTAVFVLLGFLFFALSCQNPDDYFIPDHEREVETEFSTSRELAFSQAAGFYGDNLLLQLASAIPDATIFYTLDGSVPSPSNVLSNSEYSNRSVNTRSRSFEYNDQAIDIARVAAWPREIAGIPSTVAGNHWQNPPEDIFKAVVVRAIAVGPGLSSAVHTASYFVAPDAGRDRYSLPVISLGTDRANLFSNETGIYVPGVHYEDGNGWTGNYYQRGGEWERPASFEFFETDGSRPLNQQIGIRIHGGWSRREAIKNLRLYSRSDYGTSRFRYRFFETRPELDNYNRLLLRVSGNDFAYSLIRDATMHTLVEHLDLDTQHYRPVILFINGEYWGIHNLRDRLDKHYLETVHGIPRDDVTILEGAGWLDEGDPGLVDEYRSMMQDISTGDLAGYQAINQKMCIDNFLDYHIVQWYAANDDWPHNNIKFWRYHGPNQTAVEGPFDGRWRWLLYDLDRAFSLFPGSHGHTDFDMVNFVLHNPNPEWAWGGDLIRGLLQDDDIRHEFLQRTAMYLNTIFHPDRVGAQINRLADGICPEVQEHRRRWGIPWNWNGELEKMREFAQNRPEAFRGHLVEEFEEIAAVVRLRISGLDQQHVVSINGVSLEESSPGVDIINDSWEGLLFGGVPLVMESAGVDLQNIDFDFDADDIILEQTSSLLKVIIQQDLEILLQPSDED